MRWYYVLPCLLLLTGLFAAVVPRARGDDTNLGLIPNAWTTANSGHKFASNVFIDYNVLYNGEPSVRIDPHTSNDTNTARECDLSTFLTVNPGDHIVFSCWMKVQTGPSTNNYPATGARIGVDFYSSHYLDGISWAGQYAYPVPYGVTLNWVSDANGGIWQQRVLDFIVPSSVHDYTAGGSGTPVGIIPWMQANPEDANDPTASSAWFANVELYINPTKPIATPSPTPVPTPTPGNLVLVPAFGNVAVGTISETFDADSQSVSYFNCTITGSVTDILVYCSGTYAGNARAALFAVNGGSAAKLLEQSIPVSVGTSFSWVDFPLPSAYPVTSGTTYGLAIIGNVPLNICEVAGTGQSDHNAETSYIQGFANSFGGAWGTDNAGAMSIYAASTILSTSSPSPTSTPTPAPSLTSSPSPTSTPTPTQTPEYTSTPSPNQTPNPTPTPTRTFTPTPSPSSTPTPFPNSNPTSSLPNSPSLTAVVAGGTTILAGQTWGFSVQVKGGSTPYMYQWYDGNTPLLGQTSAELTITKDVGGSYLYYCQVVDSRGVAATSNTVTLVVVSLQQGPSPTPTRSAHPTTASPPYSPSFSVSPKPMVSGISTEEFGVVAVVATIVTITGLLTLEFKRRRSRLETKNKS